MQTMKRVLTAALAAFSLGAAQAVPTVTVGGQAAGQDSALYSGTSAIGAGSVNDPNTLFHVKEQQVAGQQAWVFFADPSVQTRFTATLTFNVPILSVVRDRAGLVAGNALYGIDVDGDGLFNDYANNANMGLEGNDLVTWTAGGHTLTLDWRVQASGDMVRVTTAVPEPASLALLSLGLLAMGLKLRAQRRA
jgi:hypothetical protein